MTHQSSRVFSNFSKQAFLLRKFFEEQFKNAHSNPSHRFVWDYWAVANQYRHLRTPAYQYFPEALYMSFHQKLVEWGRKNLGCHDISPPWLSLYVDGHFQNWHADVPHGPWAFVFSLGPPKKKFSGGQTRIMKPQLLNYWQNFQSAEGRESQAFFDFIEPEFNQLLVFDARYPHSVEEVKNVFLPEEGRLVIHGWFVEPRPYVVGPLKPSIVGKKLQTFFKQLNEWMGKFESPDGGSLHGVLTLSVKIQKSGQIRSLKIKANSLLPVNLSRMDGCPAPEEVIAFCLTHLKKIDFPKEKSNSELIIPLVFK
jgi:hypothetical protein